MVNPLARALAAKTTPAPTGRATVKALDFDARRLEVQIGDTEDTLDIPYCGVLQDYTVGAEVLTIADAYGTIALGPIGGLLNVTDDPEGVAAAPSNLSLDLLGATVLASCDAYVGASLYRWRTSTNGGSTWSPTTTTADPETTFGIGQGKTLDVQVAAYASSAWTLWSSSADITYSLPGQDTETVTVTIQPTDTGTHSASWGWDVYGSSLTGYPRTMYQGTYGGSGTLIGLAMFGDRIKNLGAIEITSAKLKAKRTRSGSWDTPIALQVKGCASGTQPAGAPSLTGSTQTGTSAKAEAWASVNLDATTREGLRDGSLKSLGLAGSTYSGWFGGDGSMALTITFTRAI